MHENKEKLIVICGQSGAGRSAAGNCLEDLGYFVVDNLPAVLIDSMPRSNDLVLIVGAGEVPEKYPEEISIALEKLRKKTTVKLLYLTAKEDVLINRYKESRRRHPFDRGEGIASAIRAEKAALSPLVEAADWVFDTSDMNIHQLDEKVLKLFEQAPGKEDKPVSIGIISFGYKNGLPPEADLVLDCRLLPNPHWVEELREKSGKDPEVGVYLERQKATSVLLEHIISLVKLHINAITEKTYLTLAFGCTGGRHRSVFMAEKSAEIIRSLGYEVRVNHRDLEEHKK